MSGRKEQEPRNEYASPACSMHEADDRYMGYAGLTEIVAFLQELLEAERAGARRRTGLSHWRHVRAQDAGEALSLRRAASACTTIMLTLCVTTSCSSLAIRARSCPIVCRVRSGRTGTTPTTPPVPGRLTVLVGCRP